jgi:hypothetical protein
VTPQPEGSGLRIYIPQEQGDPDIPPVTEFPFRLSYDSQGYGGGILSRLHTGIMLTSISGKNLSPTLLQYDTERIENELISSIITSFRCRVNVFT